MKKEAALFVAGVIFATGAAAQVYKCPDASGKTVIQQVPCMGGERMTVRPGSGFDRETRYKIDEEKRRKEFDKVLEEIRREGAAFMKACEEMGITDTTPLRIGMRKEEALCVKDWRMPDKTNTQKSASGVIEQVIYRRSSSETDYLYFENGILRTIQEH